MWLVVLALSIGAVSIAIRTTGWSARRVDHGSMSERWLTQHRAGRHGL